MPSWYFQLTFCIKPFYPWSNGFAYHEFCAFSITVPTLLLIEMRFQWCNLLTLQAKLCNPSRAYDPISFHEMYDLIYLEQRKLYAPPWSGLNNNWMLSYVTYSLILNEVASNIYPFTTQLLVSLNASVTGFQQSTEQQLINLRWYMHTWNSIVNNEIYIYIYIYIGFYA